MKPILYIVIPKHVEALVLCHFLTDLTKKRNFATIHL